MKDKYLTYHVEELATDEVFISWVQEGVNDKDWEAWIQQHPDVIIYIEKARSLVEGIQFREYSMDPGLKKAMWEKINLATTDEVAVRKPGRVFLISSIAAAAAVVLILYSIFSIDKSLIISTDIGGQELVQLPDNSSINLNAVSTIEYDKEEFLNKRIINLEGEAFFEVEKGSRFIVETPAGDVEVLGTSFNVYSRGDSLAVACYTGSVRVTRAGREVVLTPGENVETGPNQTMLEKEAFTREEESPSWTKGLFTFENERLAVVFDELKRQYNINIEYQDPTIADQVTGVLFFKSGNLEEALKSISFTERIEYRMEGRKVVLSR